MKAPVLNDGLPIHTFIHATTVMPSPIQTSTSTSASHSQPDLTSNHQYMPILPSEMKDAHSRPRKQ